MFAFRRQLLSFISFCLLAFSWHATASSFFFPDIQPKIYMNEAPEWLKEGYGNDGYVTISSEVLPETNCVSLSNKNFWGSEKNLLILSVSTSGFNGTKVESEIPIATFDGRNQGSDCATLSAISLPIISNALLGSFSQLNPGNMSLTVNVKTASDTSNDLIGSAQFLLGAAAMVATGGASAVITSAASVVANPVLSEAQKRTSDLLKGSINSKVPMTFSWPEIRSGLNLIEIPIYRAEGSLGSSTDKKLAQLQNDSKAEKTKILTVRLSFNYTKTLFDVSASKLNDFPNREGLSPTNVLNHKILNSSINFLQLLNDKSPSFLQTMAQADGIALTNACSQALEKLKNAGINHLDTAIVLKSFIDEAKEGIDWYSKPMMVKNCFNQAPNVANYLPIIYGNAEPKFIIGDVQDGIGLKYQNWRDLIGPILNNLRVAITTKEQTVQALVKFNDGHDIELGFSSNISPWSATGVVASTNIGMETLANQRILSLGCFVYKDQINLNPKSLASYFLMQDAEKTLWIGLASFSKEEPLKITKIQISKFTPDWRNYMKSIQFPGGECESLLN